MQLWLARHLGTVLLACLLCSERGVGRNLWGRCPTNAAPYQLCSDSAILRLCVCVYVRRCSRSEDAGWRAWGSCCARARQACPPHKAHTTMEKDAAALRWADIAECCDSRSCVVGSCLSVVGERQGQIRKRFRLWPRELSQCVAAKRCEATVQLGCSPRWSAVCDAGWSSRAKSVAFPDARGCWAKGALRPLRH